MTPRRTSSDESRRDAFSDVGEALQRALVLSSERVQSVLEDAVVRGRMTRRDAEELAAHLVALGREQALELRSALGKSVGETVTSVGETVASAGEAVASAGEAVANAGEAVATAAAAPPTTGRLRSNAEMLPEDVDAMTAKELVALIATLDLGDVREVRDRELAGKARATVLRAIDRRLAA